MAKLVLGKPPATFKPIPVKYTLPDGQEDELLITYKYKTRSQYAEFLDEMRARAGAPAPVVGSDAPLDFKTLFAQGGAKTTGHLAEIVAAWDLADPVTADSLAALHDQCPAAAVAIVEGYADPCTQGRLGN